MTSRQFDKRNVISIKINEDDFNSFLIGMDIDDNGSPLYRLEDFSKSIINAIPEYVFAEYESEPLDVEKMREAAACIYKVEEFDLMRRWCLDEDPEACEKLKRYEEKVMRRGEFGELILHLLLRDFKNTVPLISKVYFSNSSNLAVHGFDAVHISKDGQKLWLGESKIYSDCKSGLKSLLSDLETHIKSDYLNEQFIVIKKNLKNNSIPQRDEWLKKLSLDSSSTLQSKISMINIPMLCICPSPKIYDTFKDLNCKEAVEFHEIEMRELKSYFDENNQHPLKNELNIILMLLPVRDKKELVKDLHTRLRNMQNI
jgi:hypothetical protein